MDIVLSGAAILALLPLLVGVALAIRLTSPGPALFVQRRGGWDGRTFQMLKFRTMFIDRSDADGVAQAVRDDPRVTPVGAFLRRTSLDELPQLFNILRGDMSVVGPRPHPIAMQAAGVRYEQLVPYYDKRGVMRPGLSGWAQVNGLRGPTDKAGPAIARIEHDLAYVQNFSLWLDIRIIAGTLRREFLGGSGF
jgi:lipopolysaccharide/colanic/teichoic acid biosynthesis glycosyltransferase